jgi:uncharacterized protein (DUF2147 family)
MRHTFVFTLLFLSLFISIHDAQSQSAKEAHKELIGRWVRPDGGYTLLIKTVNDDGSIDAVYLNPNPINVSKAQMSTESDKINILVELRDVGYPGSYYTLVYDPDINRLAGVYHHLVLKQNFDVYFVRE